MITIKRIVIACFVTVSFLSGQNEWALQPWVQVYGTMNGSRLGQEVHGLEKVTGDTTRIGVSTFAETRIFYMKGQQDTVPRTYFPGRPVALGDLNGDGTSDLVVGGNPTRVYLGTSDGSLDTIASFSKFGEAAGYAFGARIATGNLNNDMYDDLIVSDAGYPNGQNAGRVYVFFGGSALDTLVDLSMTGDTSYVYLGWALASGDLNNDGYDEIIARGYDNNHPTQAQKFGYVKIYSGGGV